MIGALSQAVPELMTGDVHRTSFHNMLGGVDPRTRREYVHYEWGSGGNGAFAEADGPSSMGAVDWGGLFTVQSTEVIEQNFPLLVERCGLAQGSGGNGRRRGGLGLRRELKMVGDRATYSLLSDGAVLPAFGIEGGLAAAPVSAHVRRGGQDIAFDTPGKVGGFPLRREDVLVLQAAGGGGYGDPLEREPERVAEDVREGYIDERTAHDVYGVVIKSDGSVDEPATRVRREALADMRHMLQVVSATGELYRDGRVSRRRICPLHSRDLAALGLSDGAIVELSSGWGAPLRAWCSTDPVVAAGTVPLDDFGRAALRVSDGATIQVRPLAAI
jgi:N-methylhydantoinase B